MERFCKAMTAEDRILAAVSDIKNIKDRKGTASDDAVRVILKKWWIPSDSKIATTLKWYSCTITIADESVIDITNHLVGKLTMIHHCQRFDIIHEVPSNGFTLPGGAGLILSQKVWIPLLITGIPNKVNIVTARVDQICLHKSGNYYNVNVTHIHNKSSYVLKYLPEHAVFLDKDDCIRALKGQFINLDMI